MAITTVHLLPTGKFFITKKQKKQHEPNVLLLQLTSNNLFLSHYKSGIVDMIRYVDDHKVNAA